MRFRCVSEKIEQGPSQADRLQPIGARREPPQPPFGIDQKRLVRAPVRRLEAPGAAGHKA